MKKLNGFKKLMFNLNLSRSICSHLIGQKHSNNHRRVAGFCIMLIGVLVAKYSQHINLEALRILGDLSGYGIHGIGLIPFASRIENEI